MRIEIKSRFSGGVLFAHEQDGNTPRITLEAAIKACVNLRGSDLSGSDLRGSNLRGSDLSRSDLSRSDLSGSDLRGSNLRRSDLRGSDLSRSDLSRSDLRGSDLSGSDLSRSDLSRSDLSDAKTNHKTILPDFLIVPQVGAFIAWKKADGVVLQIEIPADARRVSTPVGRKCRAEFVKVLAIDGGLTEVRGDRDSNTVYRVGEITRPDKYDDDWRVECTHGIHFFMTRKEAEEY